MFLLELSPKLRLSVEQKPTLRGSSIRPEDLLGVGPLCSPGDGKQDLAPCGKGLLPQPLARIALIWNKQPLEGKWGAEGTPLYHSVAEQRKQGYADSWWQILLRREEASCIIRCFSNYLN